MNKWIMTIFALVFLGTGCGFGLTEEEANEALEETRNRLTSVEAEVYSKTRAEVSDEDGTVSTSLELRCLSDGTQTWEGDWMFDGGEFASWSVETTFNECTFQDLTMDGSIDYSFTVETSGTSTTAEYTMAGTVDYSGSIEGTCSYDLTWTTDSTSSGASVSFSGTYCGYDARNYNAQLTL
jgi:hypothetical protein